MGLLDGIKKGIAEGWLLNAQGIAKRDFVKKPKDLYSSSNQAFLKQKDLYSSSNQAFLKQNEISRGMSRNRSVFSKLGEDSNSFKKKLLGE